MKSFKEFGIKVPTYAFVGNKMKMSQVLNREIIVHDYKIEDSKIKPGTKCLHMQIEINGEKRVLFPSSTSLISAIEQVPKEVGFPFKTTIVQEDMRYMFT